MLYMKHPDNEIQIHIRATMFLKRNLQKKIGVSTYQLIKIITRKTRMVSSSILMGVVDISKLGLFEDVIK